VTRPGTWDYCPWQHLGDLEGVELTYHDDGPTGLTDFAQTQISLRRGMTAARRRATLAHEIVHLERGPALMGATAMVDEYITECTAGLRLVPAAILKDLPTLVERYGCDAAAAFLGVDEQLVLTVVGALIASGR